jgi:hypothetical protein
MDRRGGGRTGEVIASDSTGATEPQGGAAFYCVSSAEYFLGAVGLINSLRLVGHTEPIYLLDCGLSAQQRELVAREATVLPAPSDAAPYLLKTMAPLSHPATVQVLIDADMIVTRPLSELIAAASGDRVIAFENATDRFVPEWSSYLDLGPMRRRPYVSSGLVLLGGVLGHEVLRTWHNRLGRVDYARGCFEEKDPDYPLLYLDQDVLNAVLWSRDGLDRIDGLEARLAPVPPFAGLDVLDARELSCAYTDGATPFVIHQHLPRKPWRDPAYEGAYSRLLRRLLCGDDVAIRVPRADIPLRMRTGPLGYAERTRVNAREQLVWRVGGLVRQLTGSGDRTQARAATER